MSDETPGAARPVRIMSRDRMSRTVIVGGLGVGGLVILGVVAMLTGNSDGATLGAIVAGISGCVGVVSGRQSTPGSST